MRKQLNRSKAAFTLVEMLTVIAIIAILAALVTAGAQKASVGRKISRVKSDLANLESVIERYQNDQQFYPPGGTNAAAPPLYYELSGTKYDGTQYRTLDGNEVISDSPMLNTFGVTGFANSNPETAKNYFSELKANQHTKTDGGVEVLTVPVEGPNLPLVKNASSAPINTWRYVSNQPTNNPTSFDLWADIVVGSKTNRIGNWKE